jgi:protocatechuate 3,4-dioxygenase, beta subunit
MLILTRRTLIVGAAASSLMSALPVHGQERVLTPEQTEGPFYPKDWSGDIDNDLVLVKGEAAQAIGKVTHVSGRILTPSGAPLPGAVVEIWQCDSNGRYLHSGDDGSFFNRDARDKGFQGRGRMTTGEDGTYRFRTIKPVAYPGRTPHIHFRVSGVEGELLTTQMYVADDPANESDGLYTSIRDDRARAAVTVRLSATNAIEEGALAGTFDIVVT